jgi:hypothetical protein
MKFKHNQIIDELDFFKPIRTCNYRNCNADISHMRVNAKYCSRNCKSCERKYNIRDIIKLKIEKENIKNLIDQYNLINQNGQDILNLYNKIYS